MDLVVVEKLLKLLDLRWGGTKEARARGGREEGREAEGQTEVGAHDSQTWNSASGLFIFTTDGERSPTQESRSFSLTLYLRFHDSFLLNNVRQVPSVICRCFLKPVTSSRKPSWTSQCKLAKKSRDLSKAVKSGLVGHHSRKVSFQETVKTDCFICCTSDWFWSFQA